MVHDDIEYGLTRAHGEGFDILNNKSRKDREEDERYTLDIGDVAEVWRRGTVDAAVEEAVAANVLAALPFARFRACHEHKVEENILSTMRFRFGRHLERMLHRKYSQWPAPPSP